MSNHSRLYVIALIGATLLTALLLVTNQDAPTKNFELEETKSVKSNPITLQRELFAEAAYVLDLHQNAVLYEKNAEAQLPLASLTKLMTSLIAKELLSEDQAIALTASILSTEGESGFMLGDSYNAETLIEYALIESSNDAAEALASAAGAFLNTEAPQEQFVRLMNEKADTLSLNQTYFLNPTGLDQNAHVAGAYGSARDVASLLVTFESQYPDTAYESGKAVGFFAPSRVATNTNPITAQFPGVIASKTGFTDLAGGNLAMMVNFGLNHPVVLVLLGSGYDERFTDMETLLFAVSSHFENL